MTHIFVHYHLRPGGVTRVIQHEASVFHHTGLDFLTISGGPCGTVAGTHRHLPALDYADGANLRWADLKDLARDLPKPWIWHIHNPSLGCHPDMASVIQSMAQSGERMILHLHDFAEDDRPQNLQRLSTGPPWFPCGDRIHYVVLTPRDRNILISAGLQANQVTVITNPVPASPQPPPCGPSARVIYPTRAITRKNIGEMLLLAALSPAGTRFSTTLGPGKSMHQSNYRHWQSLAKVLDLPVDWAIAENDESIKSIETCIANSTHVLSTSTQEGFGMAFVESIAWQRPLIGRSLPHIEALLAYHNIRHPYLYDGIMVDSLEFSRQSVALQSKLIKHAQRHPESAQVMHGKHSIHAASWLADALSLRQQPLPLSLLDPFHPEQHARLVNQIAQSLQNAPASDISHLDSDIIRLSFRDASQALL